MRTNGRKNSETQFRDFPAVDIYAQGYLFQISNLILLIQSSLIAHDQWIDEYLSDMKYSPWAGGHEFTHRMGFINSTSVLLKP